MTTHIDATDVAHQLARMWPHARMHVAPTPVGHTVVLGATAAELTPIGGRSASPASPIGSGGTSNAMKWSSRTRSLRRTLITIMTPCGVALPHSISA